MNKKSKRVNVVIDAELHWEIKKWAAIRNVSMKEYVQDLLKAQVIREQKYSAQ